MHTSSKNSIEYYLKTDRLEFEHNMSGEKMTVLEFMPYSKRMHQARYVESLNVYDQQCMQDLKDTLKYLQDQYDIRIPGKGGCVALAANQLCFPYEARSDADATPAPGFYPEDYIPPRIYIVNIRPERAVSWKCEPCEPTFFMNAIFVSLDSPDEPFLYQAESSLSLEGFRGFNIPRYNRISVYAQNERYEWQKHEFSGWLARVHQHEIDFFRNIEYLMRIPFSVEEMQQIKSWIKAPVLGNNCIIEGKLAFASNDVSLVEPFKDWISHHEYLSSRVIIISASQGIGPALVTYYLEKGHQVIATHMNQQGLSLVKYQENYPAQLSIKVLDLSNEDSVDEFITVTSIQKDDLIIYQAPTKEITADSGIKMRLEFIRLISKYFKQLRKVENALLVNINYDYDNQAQYPYNKSLAEKFDQLIHNVDSDLKEKRNEENCSRAISIHLDLKLKDTNTDYKERRLRKVAEEVIINCIEPIRQSQRAGIYNRYGQSLKEFKLLEDIQTYIITPHHMKSRRHSYPYIWKTACQSHETTETHEERHSFS